MEPSDVVKVNFGPLAYKAGLYSVGVIQEGRAPKLLAEFSVTLKLYGVQNE